MFFPWHDRPSFTLLRNNMKNTYEYFNFYFSSYKKGRQRFRTEWQQAFSEFYLLLISSRMQFYFVGVFPKIFKLLHIFKVLIFIVQHSSALCWRDIKLCSVLWTTTCRGNSLLQNLPFSFLRVFGLTYNNLTSSQWSQSCCISFNFNPY